MQVVSKSQFAALRNVSPGRVTQWITAGLIGPEALIGEGRTARINVDVAVAHLAERLDPNQRFGLNGLATRLAESAEGPSSSTSLQPPEVPPRTLAPVIDSDEAAIKAQKRRQAELTTERMEEQARLSRGVYVLAKTAREEATRGFARLYDHWDGALTDYASAIAAAFSLPQRDVLHRLRQEQRRIRERLAQEFATLAEQEPETIEDTDTHDISP